MEKSNIILPEPKVRVLLPKRKIRILTNNNNEEKLIDFTPEMISNLNLLEYSRSLNKENFDNLLNMLSDYYYNEEGLVDDKIFDGLQSIYKEKYGEYEVVGAKPRGEKVLLPVYLGSLQKKTEDHEITTWKSKHKGPYLLEDKIDGITMLLISEMVDNKRKISLLSHGDGVEGKDISHILPFIDLPEVDYDVMIRGEGVYHIDIFEQFRHYGRENRFRNPRNMITGTVMAKDSFDPKIVKHLQFYTYRIIDSDKKPSEQLEELQELGFKVPHYEFKDDIDQESLENHYLEVKTKSIYQMDGTVVHVDEVIDYPEIRGKYPSQMFAFKTDLDAEIGETIVTEVVWKASKDMRLKPTVHYEKVIFEDADLQRATGHNARYIVDNGIGPGATIRIKRALQVIPYIMEVVKPAPNGPSLPDEKICGKYGWNDNEVELVLDDENDEVKAGRILHFLTTLKVKKCGKERVAMLVEAGIKTIKLLLTATVEQLIAIPGIGNNLATQIIDDIKDKITNVELARIMDASNIFPGIGERRCEMILEVYPDLLKYSYDDFDVISDLIRNVPGFNKLADVVAEHLPIFTNWLQIHHMITVKMPEIIKIEEIKESKLAGRIVVFSGFRDSDLERKVKLAGGKITSSVAKKNCDIGILVLKDASPTHRRGKYNDAVEANWKHIVTLDEFLRDYL